MAQNISLMDYLQMGPPAIASLRTSHLDNTTNTKYSYADVTVTEPWTEINLSAIQGRYAHLLAFTTISNSIPMAHSPPRTVVAEDVFQAHFVKYILSRVQHALHATYPNLGVLNAGGVYTVLDLDMGSLAKSYGRFKPDLAICDPSLDLRTARNRVPADLKPSYEWGTRRLQSNDQEDADQYHQALSQLNWYMRQHRTRYDVLCTEQELVAVRRLDAAGSFELSVPVPWHASGSAASPTLTVALVIWYAAMRASDGKHWKLP